MREIKIVLNNNQETFRYNEFSIYIDGKKIEDVNKFHLEATRPNWHKNTSINLDEIIKYTIEYSAPYFEED